VMSLKVGLIEIMSIDQCSRKSTRQLLSESAMFLCSVESLTVQHQGVCTHIWKKWPQFSPFAPARSSNCKSWLSPASYSVPHCAVASKWAAALK